MITYDLQCRNGHRFEGWFEDAHAYENQRRQGQLRCPVCNASGVTRIPSTFAIKGLKRPAAPPARPGTTNEVEMVARSVMAYVKSAFDNVGAEFAKEALKMHYGVTEPRNIRGTSTADEEETLRREGIEFFKVPVPDTSPDDPTAPESEN